MSFPPRFLTLFVFATLLAACAPAEEPNAVQEDAHSESTSWTYADTTGPDSWGTINAAYSACSEGVQQSPIDISVAAAMSMDLPDLSLQYTEGAFTITDTGHGFNVTPAGSNTLMIGDQAYSLLQFHAHTPSEHTLDGRSFPMEVHFVHQNAAGQLAVVGVMIEQIDGDSPYAPVATAISGGSATIDSLDVRALLPESMGYFQYPGSLTTPPCSEGVAWNVLAQPVGMTAEQIAVFANAHGATNRPVQPLGNRMIHSEVTTD